MKDYFKEENVFLKFAAENRDEFFSKIGEILLEKKYVKKEFIASIKEREKSYPTGLNFGEYNIAIPHTNPEFVNEEGIVAVRLKNPVIFRDMGMDENDLEVLLVFVLLIKKGEEQVNTLMKLMSLLEKKDIYEKLIKSEEKESILKILKENF